MLSCGTVYNKVALTFESVDEIQEFDHSNEAVEQRVPVPCCTFYYSVNVVLAFDSLYEILKFDHLN